MNNNFLNQRDYNLIAKHIINSKLPYNIKNYFGMSDLKKILSFMLKDKKNNSDQINLILLKSIGRPAIDNKFKLNKLKLFLKNELT